MSDNVGLKSNKASLVDGLQFTPELSHATPRQHAMPSIGHERKTRFSFGEMAPEWARRPGPIPYLPERHPPLLSRLLGPQCGEG